ncbi:hypothetical protein DPEC_G00334820 [Dallia pectoralis]|uniref:Uncharacterized protein n=1 Tax=Dallia pectoralis TaxID=75939 RepID=A0ACC2F6U0_DALPE|nr:hypothetical protein DPEC_G00334820 [Dallia pectoralis]
MEVMFFSTASKLMSPEIPWTGSRTQEITAYISKSILCNKYTIADHYNTRPAYAPSTLSKLPSGKPANPSRIPRRKQSPLNGHDFVHTSPTNQPLAYRERKQQMLGVPIARSLHPFVAKPGPPPSVAPDAPLCPAGGGGSGYRGEGWLGCAGAEGPFQSTGPAVKLGVPRPRTHYLCPL